MNLVFLFCMLAVLPLGLCREIKGRVTDDKGAPVAGALISDGHSLVKTNQSVRYALRLNPKAETVYIHKAANWDAPNFHHLLSADKNVYNFKVAHKTAAPRSSLDVLILGDPESPNAAYMKELDTYIRNNPEINFVLNAGDICRKVMELNMEQGL